jgi:membrane protein YqaA with SNARE-associated domain
VLLSVPATMAIIVLINIIPVFMPPTWIFLAYVYLTQGGDPLTLALLGAIFSTLGRFVLAKCSEQLGGRFLNKHMKKNVEYVRREIDRRPSAELISSFLYALSPFPSNSLFIVSGAARLHLGRILSGFFAGRLISYYLLISAANFTFHRLNLQMSWSNPYSWLIGILGLLFAIAFLMVDWKHLLTPHKSKR